MATSANITHGKLYWFQTRVNGVGWLSGREDMSKTKLALNPRLRLEVFHVTVKRPSKVGQRKVRSLVRNRNQVVCHTQGGAYILQELDGAIWLQKIAAFWLLSYIA